MSFLSFLSFLSVPAARSASAAAPPRPRSARAASRNGFARAGNVTRTRNRRAHASAKGVVPRIASSSLSAEPVVNENENADANRAASEGVVLRAAPRKP